MEYEIRRSARRSAAIEIKNDAVIVRVPMHYSDAMAKELVKKHRGWIEKKLRQIDERKKDAALKGFSDEKLTEAEIRRLKNEARKAFPERIEKYAQLVGVTPGKISFGTAKTRWGSCSAGGNLRFNALLMLTPDPVIDSVIVHELCHIKQMNHSKRFYEEVVRVFPEYRKWNGWLKENGKYLLQRL